MGKAGRKKCEKVLFGLPKKRKEHAHQMCGWGQSFHGRAKVVQKSVMRVANLTPKSVLCLRYSCKKHRNYSKFLAKTQIQTKALGKSIVSVLAENCRASTFWTSKMYAVAHFFGIGVPPFAFHSRTVRAKT